MRPLLTRLTCATLLMLLVGAGCAGSKSQTEADESAKASSADKQADDAQKPELIDREVIFGNADRKSVRLSPDGSKLAYLAPKDGVMNVWVAPADDLDAAEAVTNNTGRGIPFYRWAYTNNHILFGKDKGGDENWHIYRVDLESGEQTDLTPHVGIKARITQLSPDHPKKMLVGLNKRDKKLHDIYRIDITTGDSKMVQKNTGGFVGWVTDDSLEVRLATKQTKTGGTTYLQPDGEGGWEPLVELSRKDALTTFIVGFDKAGDTLYLTDSRDRDKAALTALDLESGDKKVLFETDEADIKNVARHPTEKNPQAVSYTYKKRNWKAVDEEFAPTLEAAQKVDDGELGIVDRTLDDSTWVIVFEQDDGPFRYYRFDTDKKEADFLFTHRDDLKEKPLANMQPVVIESRDGMELVSYLTLPTWVESDGMVPEEPLPTMIHVHGGPWGRVDWGYNSWHQWLANRGYAVLSVNFRGSTGFGKKFLNAADKEWGGKMHDDILDARQWLIDQGVTTADQVGIMGGSYGGYATLVGMTMTPDKFVAGVDMVGPSNLMTLLESVPPYWKPMFEMLATRVGDPRTDEGKKLLKERSPLTYADQIKHPLLIGQGANDPRVKQAESEQIVEAMEGNDVPVTYVLYPDEGHGFQRPENRMSFFAITEQFLADHLGGRAQEIGDDFDNSSLHVPAGSQHFEPVVEKLCTPHPDRCKSAPKTKPAKKGEKGGKAKKGGKK